MGVLLEWCDCPAYVCLSVCTASSNWLLTVVAVIWPDLYETCKSFVSPGELSQVRILVIPAHKLIKTYHNSVLFNKIAQLLFKDNLSQVYTVCITILVQSCTDTVQIIYKM